MMTLQIISAGPTIFLGVLSFVLGAVCGSFFNVCIYRVPLKKSIVRPGSHCYACGTFIKWYDNVPMLSYLLLRGMCRTCGARFSSRYFWIETICALAFLAIFLQFGMTFLVLAHWIFFGLLLVGTFTDIDHFIIPDGITVGGLVFAILISALAFLHPIIEHEFLLARDIYFSFSPQTIELPEAYAWYVSLGWSIASACFGWVLLAAIALIGRILFRKEAMGGGDIKLFAFLGAYLGAVNCLWVLFLSALLGACIGGTVLLAHKLLRKDEYEEFELDPARAPGRQNADEPTAQRTTDTGDLSEEDTAATAAEAPVKMRIARTTSSQLHHLPYGPYIALAAVLVMFFNQELNQYTRQMLYLPADVEIVEEGMDDSTVWITPGVDMMRDNPDSY